MTHFTLKEFKTFCEQNHLSRFAFNTENQTNEQMFRIRLDVVFDTVIVIEGSNRVVFKKSGDHVFMEIPFVNRVTLTAENPLFGRTFAFERSNVNKDEYQIVAKIITE